MNEITVNIIGTIVIVLLFIIERIIGNFDRQFSTNQNWYLEILVRPNLENFKSYFDLVLNEFNSASSELVSYYDEIDSEDDFESKSILKKAKAIQSVKEETKLLNYSSLVPIRSRYSLTYIYLTANLEKLEDRFAESLDGIISDNILEEVQEAFELELSKVKGKFYDHLYRPIKNERFRTLLSKKYELTALNSKSLTKLSPKNRR